MCRKIRCWWTAPRETETPKENKWTEILNSVTVLSTPLAINILRKLLTIFPLLLSVFLTFSQHLTFLFILILLINKEEAFVSKNRPKSLKPLNLEVYNQKRESDSHSVCDRFPAVWRHFHLLSEDNFQIKFQFASLCLEIYILFRSQDFC